MAEWYAWGSDTVGVGGLVAVEVVGIEVVAVKNSVVVLLLVLCFW